MFHETPCTLGGVGCGLEKYPGIYVDVRAYVGWILEYVTER